MLQVQGSRSIQTWISNPSPPPQSESLSVCVCVCVSGSLCLCVCQLKWIKPALANGVCSISQADSLLKCYRTITEEEEGNVLK